jgi:hypothetical protein
VLQNEDLLPLILVHLKDVLQDEALRNGEEGSGASDDGKAEEDGNSDTGQSWKNDFASLILVNMSFFRAGTAILWKNMENLAPLFGLLPWFKQEYRGVRVSGRTSFFRIFEGSWYLLPQTFSSTSPSSWERFNLYASLVQGLILKAAPDITITTPWLLQLITLPGRPDPLLPNLQSISVNPEAYSGLHFLFLLLGESLESLDIAPCSVWEDYDLFPDNWQDNQNPQLAQETQESLLAVLPTVSFSAPHLRSFKYTGPTSAELFHHISNLKNLVSLALAITNPQDRHSLGRLRELPLLQKLTIEAPLLYDSPMASGSGVVTQKQSGNHAASASGPGPEPSRLQKLEFLYIYAPEYLQYPVFRSLLPKDLNDLSMNFIVAKGAMPFHYALASYLRRNSDLEHLHVSFIQGEPGSSGESSDPPRQPSNPQANADESGRTKTQYWPSSASDAEALAKRALDNSTNLVSVEFVAVPKYLWSSLPSMIQQNVSRWKALTKLCLRCSLYAVASTTGGGANTGGAASAECFPGLSFLAYTIWDQCPALEVLEFPFDEERVRQEDISEFLQTCKIPGNATTGESGKSNAGGHPLHSLTIHTIAEATRSSKSKIRLERMVGIARVLDHLFPNLKHIRGSGVWTADVELLVKSYQNVRREERARMEVM